MFEWVGKNGCESGVCNLCLHKNHIPRFHRGRHKIPAVFSRPTSLYNSRIVLFHTAPNTWIAIFNQVLNPRTPLSFTQSILKQIMLSVFIAIAIYIRIPDIKLLSIILGYYKSTLYFIVFIQQFIIVADH